jgi:hypothetical protein
MKKGRGKMKTKTKEKIIRRDLDAVYGIESIQKIIDKFYGGNEAKDEEKSFDTAYEIYNKMIKGR